MHIYPLHTHTPPQIDTRGKIANRFNIPPSNRAENEDVSLFFPDLNFNFTNVTLMGMEYEVRLRGSVCVGVRVLSSYFISIHTHTADRVLCTLPRSVRPDLEQHLREPVPRVSARQGHCDGAQALGGYQPCQQNAGRPTLSYLETLRALSTLYVPLLHHSRRPTHPSFSTLHDAHTLKITPVYLFFSPLPSTQPVESILYVYHTHIESSLSLLELL
jgi:hypothetical protein